MDKVVLLSGGLDSTTLLYYVIDKYPEASIGTIIFDYNQKHKKEIKSAIQTCVKLKVPFQIFSMKAFSSLAPSALTTEGVLMPEGHYEEDSMRATVVPNRNMVLLSLAISYSVGKGASEVYYAAHMGDHSVYPDCRPEFVEAIKKVALLCDWKPVLIEAPFIDINKTQILKKGIDLGVDYSLTWSCYNGREKSCGKCGTCSERLESFQANGIKDPLEYE